MDNRITKNHLALLCDLFGMVKWPFKWLSDFQIGDQKVRSWITWKPKNPDPSKMAPFWRPKNTPAIQVHSPFQGFLGKIEYMDPSLPNTCWECLSGMSIIIIETTYQKIYQKQHPKQKEQQDTFRIPEVPPYWRDHELKKKRGGENSGCYDHRAPTCTSQQIGL